MATDPSNLLTKTVKIHSLANRPELNGQIGTAQSFNSQSSRYIVQLPPLLPHLQPRNVSLKSDNLEVATFISRAIGQALKLKSTAALLLEQNRPQLQMIYNEMDQRIASPSIHPEHIAAFFGLLVLFIIYQIGLSKTLLLFSLISILALMMTPDILQHGISAQTLPTILKNVPTRWKENLINLTGFTRITDRMAMGSFVLFLVFCTKILFTSTATPSAPSQPLSDYDMGDFGSSMSSLAKKYTVEEIYKLGYDDAQQENEYKSSLMSLLDGDGNDITSLGYFASKHHQAQQHPQFNPDIPYDPNYSPPPASSKGSKFGIGTAMSMLALGRAVKDMGFSPNDGRFDAQLFIANVRNLEPWRMGLMGLALYRVISAFF